MFVEWSSILVKPVINLYSLKRSDLVLFFEFLFLYDVQLSFFNIIIIILFNIIIIIIIIITSYLLKAHFHPWRIARRDNLIVNFV